MTINTGLRRGEIIGLKWEDIDFQGGSFEVKRCLVAYKDEATGKQVLDFHKPKTPKSQRIIPMTEDMAKVLKSHKARQAPERLFFGKAYRDENLVFCSEDGRRLWPRNFNRTFDELLEQAGIKHKKLHTTRHTFASMLIEDGEDIRYVH